MDTAATVAQSSSSAPLRQHSNENLLKIDTHDKYSTVGSIKKLIAKELSRDANASGPLFAGMKRINKNPQNSFLFMAFETEEDRVAASQELQKLMYRGKQWVEVAVSDRDLQLTHKGSVKRPRLEDASKLTQYEGYSMEKQLHLKKAHCLGIMKSILPPKVYGWEAHSKRFIEVVESPILEGYRNHVNLSFGRTASGAATVGFQIGSMVEGLATIESAVDKDIVTMNILAKLVAEAVMKVVHGFLLAEKGSLDVFNKVEGMGFWRKLQVRHNVKGEVLLDLELDEDSTTAEIFREVKEGLVAALADDGLTEALQKASGENTAKVVSVQYHKHTGISSLPLDAPRIILYGSATLTEYLGGLRYELSPTAFFQVNTPGMARMLEKVANVAELSSGTTLLDLCSGTGTIGLSLAHSVKRVVGIEVVESAVENARRNAAANGITNATFYCGRVEHLLPSVINGLSAEDRQDIVAILDPPRAGVSSTVLKWIRGTPTIRRIVYISCEQKALERDCPGLTKPSTKAYRGVPFEVTSGFAVDLFPHTHHVEMVAVLTRLPEEDEAATTPEEE